MTLVAYIQVRGPYNNFFYNFFSNGYAAVSVFVGVVNPFEVHDEVLGLLDQFYKLFMHVMATLVWKRV